jgi:hypothetical protein
MKLLIEQGAIIDEKDNVKINFKFLERFVDILICGVFFTNLKIYTYGSKCVFKK